MMCAVLVLSWFLQHYMKPVTELQPTGAQHLLFEHALATSLAKLIAITRLEALGFTKQVQAYVRRPGRRVGQASKALSWLSLAWISRSELRWDRSHTRWYVV